MAQPLQIIDIPIYYEVHDNVLTPVLAKTMPVNSFASVYVQAVAVRPSTGDSKTWYQQFTCGRRSGAPVINTPVNVAPTVGDAGASTWNLNFAVGGVGGNDILIQIQGQNLGDTFWYLKVLAMVITQ